MDGPGVALDVGFFVLGLCYAAAAASVWHRREAVGARALAVMLAAVGWWTLAYGLELSLPDWDARVFFGELKYVGIVALTPAWLTFILQYTGRATTLSRRAIALLLVEPAAVLLLLAIPSADQLIRFYPEAAVGDEIPVAAVGPLFWVHAVYTYLLLVGGLVLLVRTLLRLAGRYWLPAVLLGVGSALPLAFNTAYNLGAEISGPVDLTPVLFGLVALILVWGLFRFRLLDLIPVARDVIVERMSDGVLVLDAYRRVVDLNPAAATMLGVGKRDAVGRQVDDVLAGLPTAATDRPVDLPTLRDSHGTRDRDRDLSVMVTTLSVREGQRPGQLVVVRDETERHLADRRLKQLLAERTRTARTLQEALRPAAFPDLAGVELAGRYLPAGGGREVGGDFYDVHPVGPGWGVVIGDVSGKGADAAVLATLVRYTTRTLAAPGQPVPTLLRGVNDAVRAQVDPERFCTVAYAVLEPVESAADGGRRLRLCLAGHPPPLLRRADGRIEACGTPGSALGLLAHPDLDEVTVLLRPGDLLCLFTDGITEARRGIDVYGEERLARTLADGPEAAEAMADALLADVAAFRQEGEGDEPGRDDATLLLLGLV